MYSLSWEEDLLPRQYDPTEPVPEGGWTIDDVLEAGEFDRLIERNPSLVSLDYEWWDFTIDDWKTRLSEYGFSNTDINFSGFWSQGDGACITATVDVVRFITATESTNDFAHVLEFINEFDGYVSAKLTKNSHHYSHWNTVDAHVDDDSYRMIEEQGQAFTTALEEELSSLETFLDEFQVEKAKEIYASLEQEYEYLISEETVVEHCSNNDYRFDENLDLI